MNHFWVFVHFGGLFSLFFSLFFVIHFFLLCRLFFLPHFLLFFWSFLWIFILHVCFCFGVFPCEPFFVLHIFCPPYLLHVLTLSRFFHSSVLASPFVSVPLLIFPPFLFMKLSFCCISVFSLFCPPLPSPVPQQFSRSNGFHGSYSEYYNDSQHSGLTQQIQTFAWPGKSQKLWQISDRHPMNPRGQFPNILANLDRFYPLFFSSNVLLLFWPFTHLVFWEWVCARCSVWTVCFWSILITKCMVRPRKWPIYGFCLGLFSLFSVFFLFVKTLLVPIIIFSVISCSSFCFSSSCFFVPFLWVNA